MALPHCCQRLLRGAPKVKLLVILAYPAESARGVVGAVGGAGELPRRVEDSGAPDLSGEAARQASLALEDYSGTALFFACVRRLRPDFRLTAEDARQIAHICRLLDGLPLAIELAAARARTMPLERIAQELEHGLHFLTTNMRDLPQRHRSMTAALDHSWRLLSERERHVLRHLWVFRGGFTQKRPRRWPGRHLPISKHWLMRLGCDWPQTVGTCCTS